VHIQKSQHHMHVLSNIMNWLKREIKNIHTKNNDKQIKAYMADTCY